ncbi:MAG: altronate dehydratase [Alphaproteobacteria bacterium]|nr:altronate dehydratase [Alphaproteobacteria bacterium]
MADGFVRLHERDNVLTCMSDDGVNGIPRGHKVAAENIAAGQPVIKYNQIIGEASQDITQNEHVHVHNLAMGHFDRVHEFCADANWSRRPMLTGPTTFDGYMRANKSVGTRNYIGVLTTVNCSATVARYIAEHFRGDALDAYENVDGVVSLVHGTGCGMAGNGEGMANLQRVLWGYAGHPNFGGILLVGLGCEQAQVSMMVSSFGFEEGRTFRYFNIQDVGGTRATVDHGIRMIKEMLPQVNDISRSTVPVSELSLALQCGGSDAYSGVTANPALGYASDLIVAHGGTTILAETPEIYGAEHLLTRRAINEDVAKKLLDRISWWEDYTMRNGNEMNNNPSPGNKAGGLTTILEKSLGAVAKGGTAPLADVLLYGEASKRKGFHFMDSPGYDPTSITGQVASGANVVCFTTGRGSVYGCKPSPSIKLATNSVMYQKLQEDMDVNCGVIADGHASVQQVGEEIYQLIVDVASGRQSKSEALGFGDAEFVPWQIGAVM